MSDEWNIKVYPRTIKVTYTGNFDQQSQISHGGLADMTALPSQGTYEYTYIGKNDMGGPTWQYINNDDAMSVVYLNNGWHFINGYRDEAYGAFKYVDSEVMHPFGMDLVNDIDWNGPISIDYSDDDIYCNPYNTIFYRIGTYHADMSSNTLLLVKVKNTTEFDNSVLMTSTKALCQEMDSYFDHYPQNWIESDSYYDVRIGTLHSDLLYIENDPPDQFDIVSGCEAWWYDLTQAQVDPDTGIPITNRQSEYVSLYVKSPAKMNFRVNNVTNEELSRSWITYNPCGLTWIPDSSRTSSGDFRTFNVEMMVLEPLIDDDSSSSSSNDGSSSSSTPPGSSSSSTPPGSSSSSKSGSSSSSNSFSSSSSLDSNSSNEFSWNSSEVPSDWPEFPDSSSSSESYEISSNSSNASSSEYEPWESSSSSSSSNRNHSSSSSSSSSSSNIPIPIIKTDFQKLYVILVELGLINDEIWNSVIPQLYIKDDSYDDLNGQLCQMKSTAEIWYDIFKSWAGGFDNIIFPGLPQPPELPPELPPTPPSQNSGLVYIEGFSSTPNGCFNGGKTWFNPVSSSITTGHIFVQETSRGNKYSEMTPCDEYIKDYIVSGFSTYRQNVPADVFPRDEVIISYAKLNGGDDQISGRWVIQSYNKQKYDNVEVEMRREIVAMSEITTFGHRPYDHPEFMHWLSARQIYLGIHSLKWYNPIDRTDWSMNQSNVGSQISTAKVKYYNNFEWITILTPDV